MIRTEYLSLACPVCGEESRGAYVPAEYTDADASEPLVPVVDPFPCALCRAEVAS
jgi:hypothetical protein